MRRGLRIAMVTVLMSLASGIASAKEPLKIDKDQPDDFAAVQSDLDKIPPYLSDVRCGGWNMEESVEGKISRVEEVPGREGVWDGNKWSGMGTRKDTDGNGDVDDNFIYPNEAIGLTIACGDNQTNAERDVWVPDPTPARPLQIKQVRKNFPHPLFRDPSCRYRRIDPNDNTKLLSTAPSNPLQDLSAYDPQPDYGELYDPMDVPKGDRQSPENCAGFCRYVNDFQYFDCLNPITLADDEGEYPACPPDQWGNKYLCTDQKVTDPNGVCNFGPTTPAEHSNSRACVGQDCRCMHWGPDVLGCTDDGRGHRYYSYERIYSGSFTRDQVPSDGPEDDASRDDIPIACYGFYDEFDPKFHRTRNQDRRCVINVDVSGMYQSQMGKGEYGQNTDIDDKDPIDPANQRPAPAAPGATDIWYTKLGWGFSLLNEDSFKDEYGQDLSNVFLDIDNLDKARMTAVWPVAHKDEPPHLAVSDMLRGFDDTAEKRIVTSWWQKNQTEVATLLHPAVVRLLLPPGYSFGADPTDPIFADQASSNGSSASSVDDLNRKRTRRVEVQLDAKDDILGEALSYIERSFLLHLEETPVPVLIPVGSPTDFRAKAQEWCTWYMRKTGTNSCNGAPGDVRDVIFKLDEYADRIEEVRLLRTELASYADKVMQMQEDLTKPISDWMRDNLTAYQAYLRDQQGLSAGLSTDWRSLQEDMTEFHDKTNAPWCMNQRYETPVYSLLDDWLPSREATDERDDGTISADGLPTFTVSRLRDLTIDFSGIAYMTGSVIIPVLQPVQVKLDIPSPPDILLADGNVDHPLPDLPSFDAVRDGMNETMVDLPEVHASASYPDLSLPPDNAAAFAAATTTVQEIRDVVEEMKDRYDKFWKSIGPLNPPCNDDSQCAGGEQCKANVCTDDSDDSLKNRKEHLECKTWNDDTCQHVEMDLMERLQRIGSRKLVMLKEDYDSAGLYRTAPDSCMPSDEVCMLLHGEKAEPAYQWEIRAPATLPDIGAEARAKVRSLTLPAPVGDIPRDLYPPYDTNVNDLLPFYDTPQPLNLSPH